MEFKLTEEAIRCSNVIFEGACEQPVDCEILLPDYCPDISRILKCQITPKITSARQGEGKLAMEGSVKIKILYVNEEQIIHCHDQFMAFSCSVALKDDMAGDCVRTGVKVQYVNCHAVNQRKLDIHGAFTVTAKVSGAVEARAVTHIEGKNLELRKQEVRTSRYVGEVQKTLTLTETLELSTGKPTVESLVRTSAAARVDDVKTIAGKAIVKGEVLLKALYMSDKSTGEMDSMEFSVPLSSVLDFEGLDENCTTGVTLEVIDADLVVKYDNEGEGRLLQADIRVLMIAAAYTDMEMTVIEDLYSTEFTMETAERSVQTTAILGRVNEVVVAKDTFALPEEGVTKIIDVWAEPMAGSRQEIDNDEIVFSGQNNICLLALDGNGSPVYYERASDWEYRMKSQQLFGIIQSDVNGTVLQTSFSLTGQQVEIRNEIGLTALVMGTQTHRTVESVVAGDKLDKESCGGLIIYYAEAGEEIWSIAKKYRTSGHLILGENELVSDTVDKSQMLLIPIC